MIAFFAFLAALLPFITAVAEAVKAHQQKVEPLKKREAIDAVLINGTPDDVSVLLSGLYDKGHRTPGFPPPDVPGGG